MSKKKEYVHSGQDIEPEIMIPLAGEFKEYSPIKDVGANDEAMIQLQRRRIIEMVFDSGLKRQAIDLEMEEQARKLRIYNLEWREKE